MKARGEAGWEGEGGEEGVEAWTATSVELTDDDAALSSLLLTMIVSVLFTSATSPRNTVSSTSLKDAPLVTRPALSSVTLSPSLPPTPSLSSPPLL